MQVHLEVQPVPPDLKVQQILVILEQTVFGSIRLSYMIVREGPAVVQWLAVVQLVEEALVVVRIRENVKRDNLKIKITN